MKTTGLKASLCLLFILVLAIGGGYAQSMNRSASDASQKNMPYALAGSTTSYAGGYAGVSPALANADVPVSITNVRAVWVPGHHNRHGRWIPGHYRHIHRHHHHYHHHRVWVPGHYNRHGRWVPGHYRYRYRSWAAGHWTVLYSTDTPSSNTTNQGVLSL